MGQAAGNPLQTSNASIQKIMQITKEVFTKPGTLLASIKTSTATTQSILSSILIPISVAMFVVGTIMWMSYGGSIFSSLMYSLISAAIYLVVIIISAKIMTSPQVQGILNSSYTEANVLELYAIVSIPMLIGQLLNVILPISLGSLVALALVVFAIFLFYKGAKEGLSCPNPIMFILAMIVINFVLMLVGTGIQAMVMSQPLSDMAMAAKATGLSEEQLKAIPNLDKLKALSESMQNRGN
ncbi:MAG: hypothetical protein R3A13_00635 [Bdellovibrionota bacterium]